MRGESGKPDCAVEDRELETDGYYLAGPVECVDDAETWRERVKKDYRWCNWLDPLDMFDLDCSGYVYEQIGQMKYLAGNCNGVLIKWELGQESVGTWQEQLVAFQNGVPTALWTETSVEQIPKFAERHSGIISPSLEQCIDYFNGDCIYHERRI